MNRQARTSAIEQRPGIADERFRLGNWEGDIIVWGQRALGAIVTLAKRHARVSFQLDMQVYFADPHSPWQRGLNENHNGLLRYYFPKDSDLSEVTGQQVLDAVHRLNHRPRRCLGWKTPHEVFNNLEVSLLHFAIGALRS